MTSIYNTSYTLIYSSYIIKLYINKKAHYFEKMYDFFLGGEARRREEQLLHRYLRNGPGVLPSWWWWFFFLTTTTATTKNSENYKSYIYISLQNSVLWEEVLYCIVIYIITRRIIIILLYS